MPLRGPTLKPMKGLLSNYHYSGLGVDAPAHTSLVLEKLGFKSSIRQKKRMLLFESNR